MGTSTLGQCFRLGGHCCDDRGCVSTVPTTLPRRCWVTPCVRSNPGQAGYPSDPCRHFSSQNAWHLLLAAYVVAYKSRPTRCVGMCAKYGDCFVSNGVSFHVFVTMVVVYTLLSMPGQQCRRHNHKDVHKPALPRSTGAVVRKVNGKSDRSRTVVHTSILRFILGSVRPSGFPASHPRGDLSCLWLPRMSLPGGVCLSRHESIQQRKEKECDQAGRK